MLRIASKRNPKGTAPRPANPGSGGGIVGFHPPIQKTKRGAVYHDDKITDYQAGGKRFRVNKPMYRQAFLANLHAVDRVSFKAVEGERIRNLVESLTVYERDAQEQEGILVHQRKSRRVILPAAYSKAY